MISKKKATQKEVELGLIRMDGDTQPRSHMDYEAVDDYGDAMTEGAKFPPIVLFFDGKDYWPGDGFHRIKGAEQSGKEVISAFVYSGSVEDARWYSYSANITNGMRRTNEDKQRAVKLALQHPRGRNLSDRQIAKHVGVSRRSVDQWRQKLSGKNAQIAKRRGYKTSEDNETANQQTRTVNRGDSTYQMRVRNGPAKQKSEDPMQGKSESFEDSRFQTAALAILNAAVAIVSYQHLAPESVAGKVKEQKGQNGFNLLEQAYVYIGRVVSQCRSDLA